MAKPRIEEQQPFLFGVLTYCKDNNLDAQQARAVCIKTAQVVPELRDELELGIEKLALENWYDYPMQVLGNTFGGLYGAAKGTVGGLATGLSYVPRAATAVGEQLGIPGAETANAAMRGVNESLLDSTGAAFRDVGHAIPGKGYWGNSPSAKLYDKRLRESEFQRGGRGLIRGGGGADFIGELALPFTGPGKVIQGAGKLIGATRYLPRLARASRAEKVTAPIARQLARMFPQGSKWGDRGRGLANYVSGSRIPTGTPGVSDMMGKVTPAVSLLNSPVNASTLRAVAPRAAGLGALISPSADRHLTGSRIANKLQGGVLDRSGTFVKNYPLESFDVNDPAQVKALQEAYVRELGELDRERVYDTIGPGEFNASTQQMRQHYESLTQGRSALDPRIRPTTDQMLQRSLEPSRVGAAKKRDVHLQEMVERQNQMAGGDPQVEATLDGWGRAFVPGITLDDAQFEAIDPKQWADVESLTPRLEKMILEMPADHPAKESAVRQVLRNRALMMAKQRGVNPKGLVEGIQKRMASIREHGISKLEVMELMRVNKDAAKKAAEAPPGDAGGAADMDSAAQWSIPAKPKPTPGVVTATPQQRRDADGPPHVFDDPGWTGEYGEDALSAEWDENRGQPVDDEGLSRFVSGPYTGEEDEADITAIMTGGEGAWDPISVTPGTSPARREMKQKAKQREAAGLSHDTTRAESSEIDAFGNPVVAGTHAPSADSGGGPTVDEAVEKVKGWYEGLDSTSQTLLWIGVPLAIAGIAVSLMSEDSGGIGMLMTVLGIAIGGLGAFGGGKWLEKLFGGGGGTEDGAGGTRGSPHIGGMQDHGLVQPFPSSPPGPWDSAPPPPGATAAGPSAGPSAGPAAATAATGGAAATTAVDNAWSDQNISAEEATAMMNDPQQRAVALQHPQAHLLLRSAAQNDPVLKADLIEAKKHPGYAIKALMHPAGQKIKVGPQPILGIDLRKEKVGKGLSRAEAELFLRIAAQAVQ